LALLGDKDLKKIAAGEQGELVMKYLLGSIVA